MKNAKWLDVSEYLLWAGSGVGSLAAIASQQIAFTAAPMSFLLLLNLVNRRRLTQEVQDNANASIQQLDQRVTKNLKAIDQQVRTLPSFQDLASLRKSVLQHNDGTIAQLQQNLSHRLAPLEGHDLSKMQQELSDLRSRHNQLTESVASVSNSLNRLATVNRVESAETTIAHLKTQIDHLQTKLNNLPKAQSSVPRAVQDQIDHLNRRINSLPQPFDATSLKQDVDGLVKVVGDMVSRRELARLMVEVEKIRQQNQTLEQSVAPMKSVNYILRKQVETLAARVSFKGENLEPSFQVVGQAVVSEMTNPLASSCPQEVTTPEQHLNSLPSSANVTQLYAEMQAVDNSRLGKSQQPDRFELPARSHFELPFAGNSEGELAFNLEASRLGLIDRPSSRALLEAALDTAASRVIVVVPYPDRSLLDSTLVTKIKGLLDRGGNLDVGWGHLSNLSSSPQSRFIHAASQLADRDFLQSILSQFAQFKRNYPTQFRFKVLGTDEDFLVCVSTHEAYGILGIHPVAVSKPALEVAVGLRTTQAEVIQDLINRFDNPNLKADDAASYYNRAITRSELGDKQGAIADYSEVLRIEPNHSIAYNNRALIRYELGYKQDAIADLNRALLSNPRNDIAYCNRGMVRAELGDDVGAIEDYGYAVQVNSACTIAYLHRGLANLKLGNKRAAVKEFTVLIQLDPQNAAAHFHRGVARSKLGDVTRAIRDFKEAAWWFSAQGELEKYQRAIAAVIKLHKCMPPVGV